MELVGRIVKSAFLCAGLFKNLNLLNYLSLLLLLEQNSSFSFLLVIVVVVAVLCIYLNAL